LARRLDRIAYLQQQNMLLAILCQHMDIKASIFLSFVSVMLFAYGFSSAGVPIVFVLALVFAVAYPIRIGATMLASRPARVGGVTLDTRATPDMGKNEEAELETRLIRSHGEAIRHNSGLLRDKHRDNKNVILTSLMLFAYVMVMTAVVRFITSPGAGIPGA